MPIGELRNQIDGIWNDFWSGGLANAVSGRGVSGLCRVRVRQERARRPFAGTETRVDAAGCRPQGASTKDTMMKKERFDQLVESLGEVRTHVTTGRFAGRISKIKVTPGDIRGVRERSGMTQQQFAAAFGIGLGTLQKWERGERRPSGAAKSLLRVMQADLPTVVKALDASPPRKRAARKVGRAA